MLENVDHLFVRCDFFIFYFARFGTWLL